MEKLSDDPNEQPEAGDPLLDILDSEWQRADLAGAPLDEPKIHFFED